MAETAGGYEADLSGDMIAPGEGARITYLRPKEDDPEWGPRMRFRLTYQGELKASGRDPETGKRDRMASTNRIYFERSGNKYAEQAQQAAQWGDGPNTGCRRRKRSQPNFAGMAIALCRWYVRISHPYVRLIFCSYSGIFHSASSALVILITG